MISVVDEPGGYGDYEPDPYYGGWEPDETDRASVRFFGLFPLDERHFDPEWGHFTDRDMDSAARFDPNDDELIQMYAAALFLRGWRLARRVRLPALALLLRWLLCDRVRETGHDSAGPLGGDRRPAADRTPPVALLRARTVLTCAPPARVCCPAGMTG